jgi:hypothetical protein
MSTFLQRFNVRCHGLLAVAALAAVSLAAAETKAETAKGESMSYREARAFLAKHTQLIELTDDKGARVAICPQWQGRVMTSTCDGLDGPSFGFINRSHVEAGKVDLHFNNYGGEERLWLSPEGGPFSLWFKPGVEQTLDNWYTPPAFNEGGWKVASGGPGVHMAVNMKLENTSSATFQLDVDRTVRLLAPSDLGKLFGAAMAKTVGQSGVKTVAYETINQMTNRGPAMHKEKGLVSMWILSMLNAGPETVVIMPYRPGDTAELGPVINSDYFGPVPPERLQVTPSAVLFRADAKYRAKIGASQRRARNVVGAIDFRSGVLSLLQFNMPEDPTQQIYMNNQWKVPQPDPYHGDVANSYNDGPNAMGQQFGAFYEIESLSPAPPLQTGEQLVHRQRIVHIQADKETLAKLAQEILGVKLSDVQKEMLSK